MTAFNVAIPRTGKFENNEDSLTKKRSGRKLVRRISWGIDPAPGAKKNQANQSRDAILGQELDE